MLTISEREIRRRGPRRVLAVFWRRWLTERALARRGVRFRATMPDHVAAAYAAMSPAEFDAINGLQDWANWRTIPRAMNGHVPERPLRVVDLGCGSGGSTRVLAFYCHPGSQITGYEFAAPLVAIAKRRDYRGRDGAPARVDFVCQGVTETLLTSRGEPVEPQSVDLVNASGVIGHHLKSSTVEPLIRELQRVLKHDGIAMLDVGPTLRAAELQPLMRAAGFTLLGHYRSWFGDITGELVFRHARDAAKPQAS